MADIKFRGFQHMYQPLRREYNGRLADTLDKIHDYLEQLHSAISPPETEAPPLQVLTPLALTLNGAFGIVGVDSVIQLVATGGVQPYAYAVTDPTDLPPGMTLDATTGKIEGVPTTEGNYHFTGQVTDGAGTVATLDCAVTIAPEGTPVLAPNIDSATLVFQWMLMNHTTIPVFTGNMQMPADLGTLDHVILWWTDHATGNKIQVGRFDTGFIAGAAYAYSAFNGDIRQLLTSQDHNKLEFVCYNSADLPSPSPFTLSEISIPAAAITVFSATDNTAARWQGQGDEVHAVIDLHTSLTNYPQWMTFWSVSPQYGRLMHGWFEVDGAAQLTRIGAQNSPTTIFPSTNPAGETIDIYAAIGTYDSTVDPTTLVGVVHRTLFISPIGVYTNHGTVAPTTISAPNYYIGPGKAQFYNLTIDFYLPLTDPKFFFARLTVQTGRGTGGSFVPAGPNANTGGPGSQFPGVQGTPIGDYAGPTQYYTAQDHDARFHLVSDYATGHIRALVGDWPAPGDDITTLRFFLYLATRQDDGSGGTKTEQATWPGGLNYAEITLDGSKSNVSAKAVVDWGPGIYTTSDQKPAVLSYNEPLNMWANPHFEDGSNPWQLFSGAWTPMAGQGISGYGAVLQGAPTYIYQEYDAKPGNIYQLKGNYNVSNLGNQISLTIHYLDKDKNIIDQDFNQIASTAFGFQPLSLLSRGTGAPAGTAFVRGFLGFPAGTGIVVWDDVEWYKLPAVGPGAIINAAGQIVPNVGVGASVGLNPFNQLIVPSGSLGNANFGAGLEAYGVYFGEPPAGSSYTAAPKVIIDTSTVPWTIKRKNTSGVGWTKAVDPSDIVAGTITAVVAILSPQINGGTITAATFASVLNGLNIAINGNTDSIVGEPVGVLVQQVSAVNQRVVIGSKRIACIDVNNRRRIDLNPGDGTHGASIAMLDISGNLRFFVQPETQTLDIGGWHLDGAFGTISYNGVRKL